MHNRCATPTRSPPCRTTPMRSAASFPPDASCPRCWHHTTPSRPGLPRTSVGRPPGTHTPLRLRRQRVGVARRQPPRRLFPVRQLRQNAIASSQRLFNRRVPPGRRELARVRAHHRLDTAPASPLSAPARTAASTSPTSPAIRYRFRLPDSAAWSAFPVRGRTTSR